MQTCGLCSSIQRRSSACFQYPAEDQEEEEEEGKEDEEQEEKQEEKQEEEEEEKQEEIQCRSSALSSMNPLPGAGPGERGPGSREAGARSPEARGPQLSFRCRVRCRAWP
jgi:hypothetical protein